MDKSITNDIIIAEQVKDCFINKTIYCSVYIRKSAIQQSEASLSDQLRKCRELATSKGWVILEDCIFIDDSISGTYMEKRDGLQKLLDMVRSKKAKFSYLLTYDTSRLSRSKEDSAHIIKELEFFDCKVFYVAQGIDSSSESASLTLGFNHLIDAEYVTKLARDTRRGLDSRFESGFSCGGHKYAYTSLPNLVGPMDRHGKQRREGFKRQVFEPEAKIVRQIFWWYGVEGYTAVAIANMLNDRLKKTGQPIPPGGKHWSTSTILGSRKRRTGILNSEQYIGNWYWGANQLVKHPATGLKVLKKRKPEECKFIHLPELRVVSEELWNKVKERQDEIKHSSKGKCAKGRKAPFTHLLTRLAKCTQCGGNIVIVSGGKYPKYGCSKNWSKGSSACKNSVKINKAVLEESIIGFLARELLDEESIEKIYSEIIHSIDAYFLNLKGVQLDPKQIKARLDELKEISKKMVKTLAVSEYTELLENAFGDIEREKIELENALAMFALHGDFKPSKLITTGDLHDYFLTVSNGLINPQTSKKVLMSTFKEITIDCSVDGEVTLQLSEKTDETMKHIFYLLGKRDSRMALFVGTLERFYTNRTFKFRLHSNLVPTVESDAKNIFIERGLCA